MRTLLILAFLAFCIGCGDPTGLPKKLAAADSAANYEWAVSWQRVSQCGGGSITPPAPVYPEHPYDCSVAW